MSTYFKLSTDYFVKVAERTSDPVEWRGIKVYDSVEVSNDVIFENAAENSLTLDHTGTSRHLTQMDGIRSERATCPDEVCQIPAGLSARFAWEVAGAAQRSTMVVFGPEIFEIYCPEIASCSFLSGHLLPRNYSCDPAMSALIRLLRGELDQTRARGLLYAQAVIRLLALEIAAAQWSKKPKAQRLDTSADARVKRAVDLIHSNLSTSLSLLDLAEASGLGPTRLTQVFKKATGKRPYEYVVDQRIAAAIRLLETTDMPLSHVALEVGFSDQQHMTHAFHGRGRQTPACFRKLRNLSEPAY